MTKVKICGLSRPQDLEAVNRAMPDFIGFVFSPSRRQVDEKQAAMLKAMLDPRIKGVGVFVNESIEYIAGLHERSIIDWAQLHGEEDTAYMRRLRKRCGCPIIKSVGVGSQVPALPEGADFLLFDTLSPQRGGTGKAFDWHALQGYQSPPYFLAGGLSPENVSQALGTLTPFCVDVSSGVETDGIKDPQKINAFVRLARRTDP